MEVQDVYGFVSICESCIHRGWVLNVNRNHAMNKREAYREVYEWMTEYLDEKWGRGGTVKHG